MFSYCTYPVTWSVVVFVVVTSVYAANVLNFHPPNKSGTVRATLPVAEYGFGSEKRLLIFNLTDIGSADFIDPSDKQFARLTWGDASGMKETTIGVELKGDKRPKLNLAFEFWEPKEDDVPCTSVSTCDDDKEEMFDFGEKYEDYVLNGDYREPTFVRDAVATYLKGGLGDGDGREQNCLVEVLFAFGDEYTYEGVYILSPTIQRRLLEKTQHWDSKGKAEDCDEYEDNHVEKVGLILEYTIDKTSGGASKECAHFEGSNVKMRYPKCSHFSEIPDCQQEYDALVTSYIDTLHARGTAEIDLDSFVHTYLAEMLLRDSDFPHSSQYFYVNPDSGILFSGPRWDYDRVMWKFRHAGWNIFREFYEETLPLWETLGSDPVFIRQVQGSRNIIRQNENITLEKIHERRLQVEQNYFKREVGRWALFGGPKDYMDNVFAIIFGHGIYTKDTFSEELDTLEAYFTSRSRWMQAHVDSFSGFKVSTKYTAWLVVAYLWPVYTSFLFAVAVVAIRCKNRNQYVLLPTDSTSEHVTHIRF